MNQVSSIERFALPILQDLVSDNLILLNDEKLIEWVNDEAALMLETSSKDILRRSVWEFIKNEERVHLEELLARSREGLPSSGEISWKTSSGKSLTLTLASTFLSTKDREQTGYILKLRKGMSKEERIDGERTLDKYREIVSSLRSKIEILKVGEKRYRTLYENLSDGVIIIDTKGIITTCSERGASIFNYKSQDLLGTSFVNLLHSDDKERVEDSLSESVEKCHTISEGFEVRGLREDETAFPIYVTTTPLFQNGDHAGFQLLFRDITDTKQAQEDLRRSEERYRSLFTHTPIAIWEEDFTEVGRWLDNLRADGVEDLRSYIRDHPEVVPHAISLVRVTDVNVVGVEMFEADCKEQLFNSLPTIIDERTYKQVTRELLAIWNGYPDRIEFESSGVTLKNTPFHTFVIWKVPVQDGKFDLSSVIVTVENISERKRVEDALRQSETRLEMALKGANLGSWDLDLRTGLETHDERWAGILGYDPDELEQTQTTWESLIHPDDRKWVTDRWASHLRGDIHSYSAEYRMRTKSGTWKWILDTGRIVEWDSEGIPIRAAGTHRDVTEQHEAILALRESERRHRMVVNSMNDLIFVFDENNRYAQYYVSDESALYVSPEEFFQKHVSEVLPPQVAEMFIHILEEVRTTEANREFDYALELDDGVHWFSANFSLHENGESVVSVIRDITPRKSAEDALRASEDRYRGLVESAPYGIVVHSGEKLRFANPAALRIMRLESVEEYGDRSVLDIVHPDYIDNVKKRLQTIYEEEEDIIPIEERWIRLDGTPIDVEVNASLIDFEGGSAAQVMFIDITDRKRAQRDLEIVLDQLKKLEAIITRSPAMAFLWRKEEGWPVEYVSDNVSQLGYSADDFISGRVSWSSIRHPDDSPRVEKEVATYLTQGKNEWSVEYRLVNASGEMRWFSDQSMVLRNSDGVITHIQGIVMDITSQKTAERSLETERDRAMLYLDIMGHDIRNNLQAIVAGINLIQLDDPSTNTKEILTNIMQATENCADIILKVKRTELLTEIPLEVLDFKKILTEVVLQFSEMENVDIEQHISLEEAPILGDEFLYHMIEILLENAIEHNPRDEKRIWVSLNEKGNGFLLSVADNGTGLMKVMKELIFDMDRRYGGVGLHQARQIVEKYGGSIELHDRIQNNPQDGAEFRIWIPKIPRVPS